MGHFCALTMRHNVDFGVDDRQVFAKRTRLAVPYRASQTPSERAEYAHVDLAIVLSSISYSLTGLTSDQLREAFEMLLAQNKTIKTRLYNNWLKLSEHLLVADWREKLQRVENIDLTSQNQWNTLVYAFSKNSETVFFWLNKCVFPTDTKAYASRISATPWHLSAGEIRPDGKRIGFSGTDDSALVLPLGVSQKLSDEDTLKRTNGLMFALVLGSQSIVLKSAEAESLVKEALCHKCSALIDTGALMANLSAESVAQCILKELNSQSTPSFRGVVYFSGTNWWTMNLSGAKWKKDEAPLSELDCFVYFDEARTRGADIRLRPRAVGMVTIGKKLKKDALVQGVGRMRRLSRNGQQQTVILAIAPDVAEVIGVGKQSTCEAGRVLEFVLENTLHYLQAAVPAWATQGAHFCRTSARPDRVLLHEIVDLPTMYSNAMKSTTLRELFPRVHRSALSTKDVVAAELLDRVAKMGDMQTDCTEGPQFDDHVVTAVQDECEREIQREQQREQEKYTMLEARQPAKEKKWEYASILRARSVKDLDRDCGAKSLSLFVNQIPHWDLDVAWSQNIYVSRAFCNSITPEEKPQSEYLRPVHALLVFKNGDVLLLSEQEEEQLLIQVFDANELMEPTSSSLVRFAFLRSGPGSSAAPYMYLHRSVGPAFNLMEVMTTPIVTQLQLFAGDTQFETRGALDELLKTRKSRANAQKNRNFAWVWLSCGGQST
eukprot:TRINITY_DN9118_c0_g1_i2.p1 TRINITY_DN9118_c0_g1~~TRINITY_DN9118_c0_g1_i2.p1  ORF type:complete len:718 (-),score=123.20 TRINITY_DN9118_c0_g1_i2:39-2192(-)